MYKRCSCLFLSLIAMNLMACASIPSDRSFESMARAPLVTLEDFKNLEIPRAEAGRSISLEFQDGVVATEHGPSRFALVELPPRADSAVLTLLSRAVVPGYPGMRAKMEIFAPQVQLFDAGFRPLAALTETPVWHRGYNESFYRVDILAEPGARYLMVYTDPQLMAARLALFGIGTETQEDVVPFVNLPGYWRDDLEYAPAGDLELRMPARNDYRYIDRAGGWNLDFGTTFGGERLAEATAGSDSIHAGSGVVATLNYHFPVSEDARWGMMLGGGMLYHPADTPAGRAEITAWIAEATFTYTSIGWRARLGISADFSPEFDAPAVVGSRTFEDAVGPVAMVEWRVFENIWLGLRAEDIDYEDSESGETLDAANVGAFVTMSFQ